ncbi:aldehyde dehydrogenase [Mesorhizobium sp. M7A.F.Ca.US.006.01.1.1]|uniref:aldehyde dehydrogenase n=1 Tax=Mesorhizobium sp. M7A.F.Ca.US.006.01.1.1 TaxID=2496707 RepID=UPI000FCB21A2|nr:aldehyde dehydrogenase [Mesorhizobium sp. M7A.F.Ca.US.006.01.1.1]RUZ77956.1 aldehyde dehydrogenase [Mesorhizobium sp. M7A.F.Ca.US.006.01.1.1]
MSVAADAPTNEPRFYDRLFIGGEWVAAKSGRLIQTIDPATEDVWAHVAEADADDVDAAVDAARQALRGPWAGFSPTRRGELIAALAGLMRRDARTLAEMESRDNGKPLRDTLGEVQRAADWLVFFAGAADKINGLQIPYRPDALAYTRLEPVGVVGAILPWNSPISLCSWKLGPALAAGNTVVLKPAEQTPVSLLEIGRLVQEAGFPAGVVNVVPGYGSIAGAALAAHPRVSKISFTGHHATAARIMQAASGNLKRCSFECGGKSPYIVFADADFERALSVAVHSAFRSTGQSCSLASRIFVERPIYEKFATAVADRASRIRVGMPFDERTHIGPHSSAEQRTKTESYITLGKESGARLLTGGGRPEGLPRGYFVEPTVFADVDNRSRLAQEEVFGPVLSVMPFDDEDEAVALANDSDYGLVGGLWTSNVGRAHRVAGRIEAGLVSVNTFRPVHYMLPYGGYKLSGFGRENGLDAIREFTEVKTVVIDLATALPTDPFAE